MKRNTIRIRVHPEFKDFLNKIKKDLNESTGLELSTPQLTKMIKNNSEEIMKRIAGLKNKNSIKNKKHNKRRESDDYFNTPF